MEVLTEAALILISFFLPPRRGSSPWPWLDCPGASLPAKGITTGPGFGIEPHAPGLRKRRVSALR